MLKKEANLADIPDNVPVDSDVSSVLAAYKSEGDPDLYEYAYMELRRFVDESLDIYKVRNLTPIELFPMKIIFIHFSFSKFNFSMSWL